MGVVATLLRETRRTVFPPYCILCGEPDTPGAASCRRCSARLDLLRAQPACPTCALSPGPHLASDGRCGECRRKPFRFDGTLRVAPYVDEMLVLLRRFKFNRFEYLDHFLADLATRVLDHAGWRPEVDAIVAVPAHWLRRLATGFYPVQALSRGIARRSKLPLWTVLRRVRLDPHQIGLGYRARIENVKDAFRVRGRIKDGACVCVIDDVMTSGATLGEVAKVLKRSGARKVYNLVLARAGRQDAELGRA